MYSVTHSGKKSSWDRKSYELHGSEYMSILDECLGEDEFIRRVWERFTRQRSAERCLLFEDEHFVLCHVNIDMLRENIQMRRSSLDCPVFFVNFLKYKVEI